MPDHDVAEREATQWCQRLHAILLVEHDILIVVGEIRASGIATLIVDRDYRKVLAHSDPALVLQKGQVVLQGTADEVAQSVALSGYLGV